MIHQSIAPAIAHKIVNSPAYPVLASFNAKMGLLVTDYWAVSDNRTYYVMGMENGLSILHIEYYGEDITASTIDSPFVQAAGYFLNNVVASKNPRYVVSSLTKTQKTAGRRVQRSKQDVLEGAVGSLLSSLAYTIKNKSTPDPALSPITEEDIHAALEVLIAGGPKIDVPLTAINRLETRYNSYLNRLSMKNGFSANVKSIFDCEKWFVCNRKSLNNTDQYYVGALNTAPMVEGVRSGGVSKAFPMETVKVQLYNSLTDLPVEFRDEVIGSLTMFKQYCKANHPGVPANDAQGYVPLTDYLFDPNSGAVAWRSGTTAFLMVDK
jgi:hypothetical protein